MINLSLGRCTPVILVRGAPRASRPINDAVNQGVTVVVAAGNDSTDAGQVTPASCNNVITVAAAEARGHLATRYSNFGSTIEIMAPGGDVQRDDDGDGNNDGVLSMVQGGYARYNGTSMAAPHVVAVAALLLAQSPNLTPAQVLQRLQQTATPRTNAQCGQPCGAGLLSAANALAIELTVSPVRVRRGRQATLTATVRQGGATQAGKNRPVLRRQTLPGVAVSPPSATTDSNGVATATVEGTNRGTAQVVAAADEIQQQRPRPSRAGLVSSRISPCFSHCLPLVAGADGCRVRNESVALAPDGIGAPVCLHHSMLWGGAPLPLPGQCLRPGADAVG